MSFSPSSKSSISLDGVAALVDVMSRLRTPKTGCPWDLEQDHKSLARYTLEEAYEVVEAIEKNETNHLREELGDLLLQIVFHAQISNENQGFTFDEIARAEAEKMIERHPHVFGDRDAATAQDVLRNWEADKAKKRAAEASAEEREASVLEGVSTALPAMTRSLKLQQRAARVGFDWKDTALVFDKVDEELAELKAEIAKGNAETIEEELGDVFFVLVNVAKHLKVDPEHALRRTNEKFERRFQYIEKSLKQAGRKIQETSLDEMEKLWLAAKKEEKKL